MNYEPSKLELAVLKKMKAADVLARATEKYLLDPDSYHGYGYPHAIDGVRVNGWERAVTVTNAHADLRAYADELERHAKQAGIAARRARRAATMADRAMAVFVKCPSCRGAKGRKVPTKGGGGYPINYWHDCEKCDGAGVAPK